MEYIDLTQTIRHGMQVFPGEKAPTLLKEILPEDAAYVSYRLESNMHTGTHMDAPFHAKSDEVSIDKYSLNMFAGSAAVIDVSGLQLVKMEPAWEALFRKNKIILFHTGHSKTWASKDYYFNYPEFDTSIADHLAKAGVHIAGFDSPSPDKAPFAFHSVFLKENRFLVENLTNLDKLLGKANVTFMAFPLKIEAEASLIRAVALLDA